MESILSKPMIATESGSTRSTDQLAERPGLGLHRVGIIQRGGSQSGVEVEAQIHQIPDRTEARQPRPACRQTAFVIHGQSREDLGAPTEVGPGRRQVAGLEHEVDMFEELTIEPPVDPGKFRDLVEGPFRSEDRPDIPEEAALQLLAGTTGPGAPRSRGRPGRSRDPPGSGTGRGRRLRPPRNWRCDPNRSRRSRAKSASRSITMTWQSGRAFSAIARVIGPVPAPSSTRTPTRSHSIFRKVVRDSQRLLGAMLAMGFPRAILVTNLPRNKLKSFILGRGHMGPVNRH